MRSWRAIGVLGVILLVATGAGVAWYLLQPPRLNVVIISLDTTRADRLGCYGRQQALTPVLDNLAANGVLFEHATTPTPLTLPAHASLFTGLYPPEHGLHTNGQSRLADEIPTLAKTLAARGYATGGFIASFVLDSKFGLDQGFATYGDDLTGAAPADHALHRYRPGNLVVDEALQWLQGHHQRPFLCWVHLYDPHSPYLPHQDLFGDRFKESPYDGEIAFVDQEVARIREFLQMQKLDQRTLVIVVGDHGEGLNEHQERKHGKMLYQSTLHVPLLMALPGVLPAGRRIAGTVSLVDLLPTILETVQADPIQGLSGRSLLAVAKGNTLTPRACYSETDEPFHEAGWSPLRGLTTDRWKYIRAPRPELYDLQSDPTELRNLYDAQREQAGLLDQELSELERGLVPRQRAQLQLSPREQRTLESLGYVASAKSAGPVSGFKNLPDIKDMMPHFNALEDAQEQLEVGTVEPAIAQLRKLVAVAPEYEMAQVILGDALTRSGKFAEAVAQFQSILKRNPESEMALSHLGDAQAAQGQYSAAIRNYQLALQRDPDSDGLQYNLGKALVQAGRISEAIPHFQAALELDPGFVFAYVELGSAFLRLGQPDEALAQYELALKYNPDSLQAHMNLASVYAARSQLALALPHLEHASRVDPQNADIHYQLGAVLASQGRLQEAVKHLSAATRLDRNHNAARELLQQLQGANP